jgi:hypothetical protein
MSSLQIGRDGAMYSSRAGVAHSRTLPGNLHRALRPALTKSNERKRCKLRIERSAENLKRSMEGGPAGGRFAWPYWAAKILHQLRGANRH